MSDSFKGWNLAPARREGWFLFEGDTGVVEIFAFADSPFNKGPFPPGKYARDLARAYVQQRAAEGSAYHIDALARTQLL